MRRNFENDLTVEFKGTPGIWSLIWSLGDNEIGDLAALFVRRINDYSMNVGSCAVHMVSSDWMDGHIESPGTIHLHIVIQVDENDTYDPDEDELSCEIAEDFLLNLQDMQLGAHFLEVTDIKGWHRVFIAG